MTDKTTLPNLRILPTNALVTHEDPDQRRVRRLSQRIVADDSFKHPPIVAAIPDSDKFVVLDGANRVTALKKIGVPHAVVQVVSYESPGVRLDTWYHVIAGIPYTEFKDALDEIPDMMLSDCHLEEARQALTISTAIACIVSEFGAQKACHRDGCLVSDISLLGDIVGTYRGRAEIYRTTIDNWDELLGYHPDMKALILFPRIRPADVINAAQNGIKLPTGISRHIISPRALNIHIPLDVLKANWSLERKTTWLENWYQERMNSYGVRLYSEATFLFDE